MDIAEFVRSTGGGEGAYEHSEELDEKIFRVKDAVGIRPQSNEMKKAVAYGTIVFEGQKEKEKKPYILVPWNRPNSRQNPGSNQFVDQNAVLFYIQNVWRLSRPKLLLSICAGLPATSPSTSPIPKIDRFLDALMEISRKTSSWIVSSGQGAGIIKSIGEAKKAFGGAIPLIGIATWGITQGIENLLLPSNPIDYKDLNRKSVKYTVSRASKRPALDPNHSHFILVDDGTLGEPSKEIPFRTRFEQCACLLDARDQSRLTETLQRLRMGWDGCREPATASGSSGDLDEVTTERSHAISIVIGGGLSLVDSVVGAVRNHTPVLVLKGSGAAADLIAACVRIMDSEVADDSDEDDDNAELAPFDDKALKVALCVKKLILFMSQLKDLALQRKFGLNYDWPPVPPATFGAGEGQADLFGRAESAPRASWRNWKRVNGQWTYGRYMDGVWIADRGRRPLEPGSAGHLDCVAQMGMQLVAEYNLAPSAQVLPPHRLLRFSFDLFEVVSSGLCVVYDLDATLTGNRSGHSAPAGPRIDVEALLMQCITRRLDWDAYTASMASFIGWWRRYTVQSSWARRIHKLHPPFEQSPALLQEIYEALDELPELMRERGSLTARTWKIRAEDLRATREAAGTLRAQTQEDRVLGKVKLQLDIAQRVEFDQLKLNIEWGNAGMVRTKLDELVREQTSLSRTRTMMHHAAAAPLLDQTVLNKCLHLALVHDSSDIAALLFSRGADIGLYEQQSGLTNSWRELVVTACAHIDNEYLVQLVQRGWTYDAGFEKRSFGWASIIEMGQLMNESHKVLPTSDIPKGNYITGGHFDPSTLVDDAQTKAILLKILSILLPGSESNIDKMDFSQLTLEMQLSLCLLLTNRRKLSKLLWIRDFDQNASSLLQNALISCLVCRKLQALPIVSRHHHLKETFRQTADEYEEYASSIVKIADEKNSESTLKALELPLAQCSAWSTVDLIFKAQCKNMVKDCLEVCEEAVQRRFSGNSGLSSTISRWRKMFLDPKATGKEGKPNPFTPILGPFDNWTKLVFCASMDLISLIHFFSSFVPFNLYSLLLVPLMSWTLHHLFGNSLLSLSALLKWIFPWLPTSIIGWTFQQIESKTDSAEDLDLDILPIDLFVLDLLAHISHAVCLTTIILKEDTVLSFLIEMMVLFLLVSDIIAHIVLGGVNEETSAITTALARGFAHFFSHIWEDVDDMITTSIFIAGFLSRCSIERTVIMVVICVFAIGIVWMLRKALNLKRLHRQKKEINLKFEHNYIPVDSELSASDSKDATNLKSDREKSQVKLSKSIQASNLSLLSPNLKYFGLEISIQDRAAGFIFKIQWFTILLFIIVWLIGRWLFMKGTTNPETTSDGEIGFLLYGFCLFCMWLRILLFVQVQQELGQFVGVLISMARDLGFFGIVWIILILAFSSAMLGAGIRSSEENQHPMQSWSGWWLLRTYLQSLGQDNIVMSSRYEKAREDSGVSYCFDLHDLYESYTYKTSHHEISLIWNFFKYIRSSPTEITAGSSLNSNAGARHDAMVKSILGFKKFLNANMAIKTNKDTTNREKELRQELEEILASLKKKFKLPNGDNVVDANGHILISRRKSVEIEGRTASRSIQPNSASESVWIKLFTEVKPDVYYGRLFVLDHFEESRTPEKASWVERLCFIMEGNLCSAPDDAAAEPEVICAVSEVRTIWIRGNERPENSFSLVLEPHRTLTLQALNEEDKSRWVNKIIQAAFPQLQEKLMRVRKELSEAVRENEGRASEVRRMQVFTS